VSPGFSENVAALEESDLFKLLLHFGFFVRRHVAERRAVRSEVQTDEFHDALAADDVSAEAADHVDDFLGEVLELARLFDVAGVPGVDYRGQAASVVVRGAADAAARAAHRQRRKNRLVLAVEHVESAVLVEAALVVFVERFVRVFDSGEIRNAPVHGLQQVEHRQERAVERGNVVVVERKIRRAGCDFFAVFGEFLDAADFRERRGHHADAPRADRLRVLCESAARPGAAGANMDDHLEARGRGGHPRFGELHALFVRKHVSFAGGAVDENALQAVFREHRGVARNGFEVYFTVWGERRERCVDESGDLLHFGLLFADGAGTELSKRANDTRFRRKRQAAEISARKRGADLVNSPA